jgi:signal transduction histidine kinase/HAMP domain-containing protein
MAVAMERSPSAKARSTMERILRRVEAWNALRLDVAADGIEPKEWRRIDQAGARILKDFNYVADQIAGDGFVLRQNATASIEGLRNSAIVAVVLVVAAALVIGSLLSRAISRPLRQAVNAAERISKGELTADIPNAGSGEMKVLLKSMSRMQRNLRAIMAREEELRRSAQLRLADAIENSPEGIVLLNAEYRLVIANTQILDSFAEIADSFSAEAHFFNVLSEATKWKLMGRDESARLENCCREATMKGQAISDIKMADGRWLRFRFSRARDRGIIVICTDITDIIRRENQFRVAKEEAEAANKAKTEFLANMSHELRTPLNAVIGFSQMLKDEILGPVGLDRYRDYACDIHNSGTHLLSIINDILDLSKIEAGKMDLYLGDVNTADCVEASIRLLRPRAADRKIRLSKRIGKGIGPVRADERMLKQVLMNLLSNAIKFTESGGEVTVIASKVNSDSLAISVRDTGIGMTAEQIRIASEPFGQVDSSLGRKYEGTGLGLPLAKRMVELHGGTLDIASQPNIGTTVTLTIPFHPPARIEQEDEAPRLLAAGE